VGLGQTQALFDGCLGSRCLCIYESLYKLQSGAPSSPTKPPSGARNMSATNGSSLPIADGSTHSREQSGPLRQGVGPLLLDTLEGPLIKNCVGSRPLRDFLGFWSRENCLRGERESAKGEKNLEGGRWCRGCRVDGKFGVQEIGLRGRVAGIDSRAWPVTLTVYRPLSLHPLCTISPLPDFSLLSPTLFFLLEIFPSGFFVK